MMENSAADESWHPKHLFRWAKFKATFAKLHPTYFYPDGLTIFVGPQGSGKTLSAVNYVYRLLERYPNCKLCTNLTLIDYPVDFERVFPFIDNGSFQAISNGEEGVIFLVDEIQLYLSSLERKAINVDVLTQISQQRKQRKHIVATSQVFGRLAKPLREQFSSVVLCKQKLGFLQFNQLIDRDSISTDDSSGTELSGVVRAKWMWLHDPMMYKRYDTYAVIQRGKFVDGENQRKDVYEGGNLGNASTSD